VSPAATPSQPPATAASDNPLRKQTLLGIAPVLPQQPKAAASEPEPPSASASAPEEPAPFEPAGSVPSLQTPALVATDAPTTSDLPSEPEPVAKSERAKSERAKSERAKSERAVLSISHDDLLPLKRSRPRWVLPASAAAVIALGVLGLRSLDRAPEPVPAELAHPHTPGKAAAGKALGAAPRSDDDGDDDDDDDPGPHTGSDDSPDPTPPDPDPLKGKAAAAPAAAAAAPLVPSARAPSSAAPAATAAPSAAPAAVGDAVRINVESDPPGARLFWKGKEVGTTPFVLELQPGEKHAYELGLPGYTTRKVVIDGSKTEISIGLRPDPNAPTGANARK
jgi:hypothetical protein